MRPGPGRRAHTVPLRTIVTSGEQAAFQFVSPVRRRRLLIDPQLTLLSLTE